MPEKAMYLGPKHRIGAVLRTIIVFIIIVLIMLLYRFYTPIPPYPEGGGGPGMGLEVNLGSSDQGMNDIQPGEPLDVPLLKESAPEQNETEKILTQDNEETESIETAEKPVKKAETTKKKVKKIVHDNITDREKPVAIKQEQKINQKAMFPAKKEAGNEGITGKPGDQGKAGGVEGSPLYTGNGKGSGGGTGGGTGDGTGTGKGSGISFSLEGRNVLFLKKPEYNYQSEGKVVVEITVDKTGAVTRAVPGAKGSTTLDDYLLQVAKKAALESKFTPKPDATIQKGTITYHFLLQ
jgi:TonB family protein